MYKSGGRDRMNHNQVFGETPKPSRAQNLDGRVSLCRTRTPSCVFLYVERLFPDVDRRPAEVCVVPAGGTVFLYVEPHLCLRLDVH